MVEKRRGGGRVGGTPFQRCVVSHAFRGLVAPLALGLGPQQGREGAAGADGGVGGGGADDVRGEVVTREDEVAYVEPLRGHQLAPSSALALAVPTATAVAVTTAAIAAAATTIVAVIVALTALRRAVVADVQQHAMGRRQRKRRRWPRAVRALRRGAAVAAVVAVLAARAFADRQHEDVEHHLRTYKCMKGV